ncbi:MAG: SIS domain-containing protein, partial [Bacteroidota bacterium]
MDYLNKDQHFLEEKGALHTAMEISSQPWLWNEIYRRIREERGALGAFLDRVLPGMRKIILTGAGTSAYIGYSLEGVFQRSTGITTVSVPTTHLVSHPADYFDPLTPTLLISFARSGSSPESLATVKLFDRYCPGSAHLVITCNSEGELARHHFRNDCYIFNLPPEANDKSLAMTSSYSGMLLAAYLIGNLHELDALETAVATLCHYGQRILSDYTSTLQEIARMPFQRAVFLGSGPAYGTSRESNLKLQEMTDGQIICKND